VVPFLLTVLLGQPNPNGKKRVSQTAVHFVRLLSRPLRHFRKGKGTSHPEGGGKLPLLEWKLLLYFFRAYRYFEIKKRFMDEVIGMTSGYGCGKRRKSGTVGYLLNQSSDKPSITTTGGEAKLRRQLRFLLASFLAFRSSPTSQVALGPPLARPSRAVLACTSKQISSLILLLCRQAWANEVGLD